MAGRVTVVGAGIIGLSCAVRLAEAGLEVNVLARDLPPETSSAVAGALWLPPPGRPSDDVARWARETLTTLLALSAGSDPAAGPSGVRVMPGTLLSRHVASPPPAWAGGVEDLVQLTAVSRPAPGYALGYATRLPVVHLPQYLRHLTQRLRAADGTLTRLPLAALPERGVVVNATGVSARALAADPDVRPVRSQVVRVADPGLTRWWCEDAGPRPTYVLPHGGEVIVGGTLEDGDWSTTPDPQTARDLLARAAEVEPALRGARVLGTRVGLHAARGRVRLELERRPTLVDPEHVRVHCYGHGGAGLTLSWGCAGEVLELVSALLTQPARSDQG